VTGSLMEQDEVLRTATCLILCNYNRGAVLELITKCRKLKSRLIVVGVYGIAASVFVDFGPAFEVTDATGEEPKVAIIENIAVADANDPSKLRIFCVDDKRLPFSIGDMVEFQEVEGLEKLNTGQYEVVEMKKHELVVATG